MSAVTLSTPNSTFNSISSGQGKGVAKSYFERQEASSAPEMLLSPLANGISDLTSSLSGAGRGLQSTWNAWQGLDDPVASTALAVTTCFNLVSGIVDTRDAIAEARKCSRVREVFWKVQAQLKIVKSALTAVAGFIYIPVRALTIACLITASKVGTAVSEVLGTVGGSLFSFVSFLSIIAASMGLYKESQFAEKIKAVQGDPAKCLTLLQGELALGWEERTAIRNKVEKKKDLSAWDRETKILRTQTRLLKKKEYLLSKATSQECVELIKRAALEDAPTVVQKVLEANKQRRVTSAAKLVLSTMAIAAIFTAGVVAAALTIMVGVGWVIFEINEVYNAFKSNDAGKFDKLWLLISTVICMAGIITFSFVSAGIVPLIVGGVMGICVLAMHGAAYASLRKGEAERASADRFKAKFLALDAASQGRISHFVWERLHEDREKILLYDKTNDFGREYCLARPNDPAVSSAVEKHLQESGDLQCVREVLESLRVAS